MMTADLIQLLAGSGRDISGQCNLSDGYLFGSGG